MRDSPAVKHGSIAESGAVFSAEHTKGEFGLVDHGSANEFGLTDLFEEFVSGNFLLLHCGSRDFSFYLMLITGWFIENSRSDWLFIN